MTDLKIDGEPGGFTWDHCPELRPKNGDDVLLFGNSRSPYFHPGHQGLARECYFFVGHFCQKHHQWEFRGGERAWVYAWSPIPGLDEFGTPVGMTINVGALK